VTEAVTSLITYWPEKPQLESKLNGAMIAARMSGNMHLSASLLIHVKCLCDFT